MKTKIGNTEDFLTRFRHIKKNRFSLGNFMTSSEYQSWFRKGYRGKTQEDDLGVFRFPNIPNSEFDIDQEKIFKRFAQEDTWKEWNENGTTVA